MLPFEDDVTCSVDATLMALVRSSVDIGAVVLIKGSVVISCTDAFSTFMTVVTSNVVDTVDDVSPSIRLVLFEVVADVMAACVEVSTAVVRVD